MITPPDQGLSYAEAGVDISAYERVLERLVALARTTHTPAVRVGAGPFAGLYELSGGQLLAATADGVGTKIKVAIAARRHRGIGHDLVNHCANDVAAMGARPLFFLDYFAAGRLEEPVLLEIVEGLTAACREAACALLGGETAEMPGVYALGDYDLAGFMVGLVEPDRVPRPETVAAGDVLLALPSSGLHTNGYSLARRVFADVGPDEIVPPLRRPLTEELLEPHRLHAGRLRQLWPRWKTAAHITGGGLIGNAARMLPSGLAARFHTDAWTVPPIFELIQRRGRVDEEEMRGTFNLGLGMVLTADPEQAPELVRQGLLAVGEVVPAQGGGRVLFR